MVPTSLVRGEGRLVAMGDVELTLCQIQMCHVFKIPPRKTAGGHLAKEWTDDVWQGRLRIIQKGKEASIYLVDKDTGATFATCPVRDGSVERAADSSRYFVLRIQNANGKARPSPSRRRRLRSQSSFPPNNSTHVSPTRIPHASRRSWRSPRKTCSRCLVVAPPSFRVRGARASPLRALSPLPRATTTTRASAPAGGSTRTSVSHSTSSTRRSTSTSLSRSLRRSVRARRRAASAVRAL